ncbi:hypothetical protein Q648_00294 [Bartonella quintana JK 12]|uniref:Thiamine pyrophosphate enzyme TPP-binding domain-containing protein n=2 Tax=Bartonella quintana TaxID=803 RepID=W3TYT0_BARQI|nr:thiamine pyrophosphate-dependent enzyme [Bartonella quintana]ETS13256.1 hypothetical protein Q651_00209 [Bartonella quintana BQ2-D70]ETS14087.1 hypothetical protein Q650_00707 [Bartonella quintana JK 73rel]ETS15774.1 hypothetical protein Q649_00716 [Bartonella quintana JK 73]ETS17777.1 hypothetical protein Q647_00705 [Bartonella quintana JK 7]ETS18606.1 hypothetical protein Q648_00294 [Bartonella quintana JK 12]KEC59214.1 hypothetical protein O93_00545 [Bartonella quintana JK 19]KEC62682.
MTSGGLGTMDYDLPAAIGVQIAHPDALNFYVFLVMLQFR